MSSTAGSFIRPSRQCDTPLSFLEALEQKYALSSSADMSIQISGKTVEEVGFEKIQRQLQKYQDLEVVILDKRCISVDEHFKQKSGQSLRIANLHLRIQNLDLSRNLLETWMDILSICYPLKHLQTLNVA